jgi:hypothetical protein
VSWDCKEINPGRQVIGRTASTRRRFLPIHISLALSKALDKRFLDLLHVRLCLLNALGCEKDLPHRQIWPPSLSVALQPEDCIGFQRMKRGN